MAGMTVSKVRYSRVSCTLLSCFFIFSLRGASQGLVHTRQVLELRLRETFDHSVSKPMKVYDKAKDFARSFLLNTLPVTSYRSNSQPCYYNAHKLSPV